MKCVLVIILLWSFMGCSPRTESRENSKQKIIKFSKTSSVSKSGEVFAEFYRKFSIDSEYQVSRIVFPLIREELDEGVSTISTMTMAEWGYMNFVLGKPYIITNTSKNDTTKINIQIEDTGVYVDYLFTTVNGKWMLVKIVDQST